MLLVFGSVSADLLFKVKSLPRPGETVLCPSYQMAPGGKGSNQAAAAAKAGAETKFVGHLGDDAYGPVVRAMLVDAGIDTGLLATSPKPTAIAVIGVDEAGENQIIVGSAANLDTHAGQIADSMLGAGVTVLCQNEVRPDETFAMLKSAKRHGARTILNLAPAAPVPADVLDALDVLVVNEIEAEMAAGVQGEAPETVARRLATAHHLVCVVTLGSAGAIAVGPDSAWRVGAMKIVPVDTTGAGDTFVGVLAAGLDGGRSLEASLHRAAVAAALSCEQLGAQTAQPDAAAIEARLPGLPAPAPL